MGRLIRGRQEVLPKKRLPGKLRAAVFGQIILLSRYFLVQPFDVCPEAVGSEPVVLMLSFMPRVVSR